MPHIFSGEGLTQLVQTVGYSGLFIATLVESGVFFGFFLPGSSMLFTAGILAGQGIFNPWILIPLVTVAAVLGDSIGYWFGTFIETSFLKKTRYFRQDHLDRAKSFFEKHGMQAVFLARFVPVVRTFAPIVAGIVEMRYRLFLIYNIAGALCWAAGVTFAGYYLGTRVPFVSEYITQIVIAIIIVSSIPLVLEMYKSRKSRHAKTK